MGMTVRVEINQSATVQIAAARRRGLQRAADEILLPRAVARAPREAGEPKHGVHGADTAFTRLEVGDGDDRVAVGFEAFWMLWQHEDLDYKHPNGGEAKFLEKTLLVDGEAALEVVAATMREAGV